MASVRLRRSSLLFAAAALLPLLAGCPPPCARTCKKVLKCGNLDSDRVSQLECEDSCQEQIRLYDAWDDEEKQDLFSEHRRCLMDAECGAIASGTCYDGFEGLFVFGEAVESICDDGLDNDGDREVDGDDTDC